MKYLLYSTAKYPTNSGAGKNAFRFAKELFSYSDSVRMLSLNVGSFKRVTDKVDGIGIIGLPYFGSNKIVKRLSKILIIPLLIPLILKNDVFVLYSAPPGYKTLIIISYLLKKKVILRSTSLDQDDIESLCWKYGKVFFKLNRFIFDKIFLYYAINPEFKRRYNNIYPSKNNIFLSTQGVDLQIYKPLNMEDKNSLKIKLGFSREDIIVLSVGYLLKRKGYKENFDVLKVIDCDYKYIIIGDYKPNKHDNYHKNWPDSRIEEMNSLFQFGTSVLKDKVKFLGSIENVNEYMQIADIFLHNSYAEGTPNVVLEAMASGLPIILHKLPGLEDFLVYHNINGFIVNNYDELKTAIDTLLINKDLRLKLGEKSYSICEKKFDNKKIMKELINKIC